MRLLATIALLFILAISGARAEGLVDCYRAQGAQEGGDPVLAINYYTRCITWDGQSPEDLAETYNNRGIAYVDQDEYGRAILDFDKAIRLHPSYAHAYYNRGLAHLEKGDQDAAVHDYNQAVRLDPRYADTPYAEALTMGKPQSNSSTTSSPPATQALDIAPAGVSETGQQLYAIHLASVRTEDGAETGWSHLQRQFPELIGQQDLIIRSIELETQGTFFRIMTGPFQVHSMAQDLCDELKIREQYCMVLRLTEAR
jgi:tetratricopeptide (TPR) repeat protein